MTATGARFASSSGEMNRPRSGATPSTGKRLADTSAPRVRSRVPVGPLIIAAVLRRLDPAELQPGHALGVGTRQSRAHLVLRRHLEVVAHFVVELSPDDLFPE